MEDHHVDRSDVEAQQCVKLTDTNSSIGLIALISHACFRFTRSRAFWPSADALREGGARAGMPCILAHCVRNESQHASEKKTSSLFVSLLRWPGDNCEAAAPDPIPNSAVKRLRANGTASLVAGE